MIDKVNKDFGVKHWLLVVEICKIKVKNPKQYFFQGFTLHNEVIKILKLSFVCLNKRSYFLIKHSQYVTISFDFRDLQDDRELRCPLSEVESGQTLVLLYPKKVKKYEKNKFVIVKNPDSYFVFKVSMIDMVKQAAKLLTIMDSVEEKKELECFGCGAKTSVIMQCSACKLAKYCSKECQKKSWKMCHKNLCNQSEILLRVASLPRHQDKPSVPCFSFNLNLEPETNVENNANYNRISIPAYVYKPEFVQKSLNNVKTE